MPKEKKNINVVIVHHHLNRGGVTHVILNQLEALMHLVSAGHSIQVAVLYGGRASFDVGRKTTGFASLRLSFVCIPQLEYDSHRQDFSKDADLDQLIDAELAKRGFEKSNTILHIHNHSLGKNAALVPAIRSLADDGYRLLLQIHDFAEDFRSSNFRHLIDRLPHHRCTLSDVYPDASQIQYAAINQRDESILQRLELKYSFVNYLPNSVPTPDELPEHETSKQRFAKKHGIDPARPLMIYPVRGIRRKNLGEAILLSTIAPTPVCLGVTLAPLNETEKASFDHWRQFVTDHHLPVLFGIGGETGLPFETILASADFILTTSVAEGFGLVYLESYALGKEIIGREIGEITSDFRLKGIKYQHLYNEIRIPLSLLNWTDLRQQLQRLTTTTWSNFDQPCDAKSLERHFESVFDDGFIDFAKLTSHQQQRIIAAVVRDPRVRTILQQHNPELTNWLTFRFDNDLQIDSNRKIVEQQFSTNSTSALLLNIYRSLVDTPISTVTTAEAPTIVLSSFLGHENFHPIRVEQESDLEIATLKLDRSIINEALFALEPVATGVKPRLGPRRDIKAILFDIYGTLLVSSSGDVGTDPEFEDQQRSHDHILDRLLARQGLDLKTAATRLSEKIASEHQELRTVGVPFPEIEIAQLWQSILNASSQDDVPSSVCQEVALRFELLKNPVWKMPGFDSCLDDLKRRQLPVGIISNAQFYTPLILEALANRSLEQMGFRADLSHFSYRIGRAKPDRFLYKLAADSLKRLELRPDDVLYVGNDMTKDILPAKETGFITGLFAGDQRSLRLQGNEDPQNHHSVDHIFTDLFQISHLLQSS